MPSFALHRSSPRPVPQSRLLTTLLVVAATFLLGGVVRPSVAQEAGLDFSPGSGQARVIAQGVAALPEGDVVWRTVRARAPLPEEATFEERSLGFVLATTGPILVINQESGEQRHLGVGEAALVPEGSRQQRVSLGEQAESYLAIELVAVDAPAPPAPATVLQPGQPFVAPDGLRDLDLVSATLEAGESYTVPDSGAKNVILITEGAMAVTPPGSQPVVLLAGEAASFSGELEVAAAPDGAGAASFVVAMIGPEIPPAPVPIATDEAASEPSPTAVADTGEGSLTVEIYTCPAGMTVETLNAAVCAPATGVFDVTLSGGNLAAPLTIGDAVVNGPAYTWEALPFGEYVVAQAVLPRDFDSYILSARDTSGSPETGYRVTIDEADPNLAARIYNFRSS